MPLQVFTIGGYGFTDSSFLSALTKNEVDTLVDVRQRRGLRGSKYAFLNSTRLQALVASANIRYVHALGLAPTTAIRSTQKQEDQANAIRKRDRQLLSAEFIDKYSTCILDQFDDAAFLRSLESASALALFCVETEPSACHRSLAATRLAELFNLDQPIRHLRP
ncbi:DUF488 family protein [Croceibacterium mercuriale]|uniref:DUF488 family protein n=1 Tax=Croceibacterium mercuriale TaxID=1572751 RepID=UPI0009DE0B52